MGRNIIGNGSFESIVFSDWHDGAEMTINTATSCSRDGHGIVINLTSEFSEIQWSRVPTNEGEFRMGEQKRGF
jgi:hypothetical protein